MCVYVCVSLEITIFICICTCKHFLILAGHHLYGYGHGNVSKVICSKVICGYVYGDVSDVCVSIWIWTWRCICMYVCLLCMCVYLDMYMGMYLMYVCLYGYLYGDVSNVCVSVWICTVACDQHMYSNIASSKMLLKIWNIASSKILHTLLMRTRRGRLLCCWCLLHTQ
jgi:hypothetical protein